MLATSREFYRDGPFPYGDVAVMVEEGEASTVAAHVHAVALEGESLYVVGQAGRFQLPGPEAAIVVRIPLPD